MIPIKKASRRLKLKEKITVTFSPNDRIILFESATFRYVNHVFNPDKYRIMIDIMLHEES